MPPSVYAQALLLALEIYRNHANKPPEWTPTEADWQRLRGEVETATIDQLHAAARARKDAREGTH
jgi:hypothetical protein